MEQRVVPLAPGHVPDEIGGSYDDGCAVLDLDPIPGGYLLYLADVLNSRCTVISTDTGPLRDALDGPPTAGGGRWVTDLSTVAAVVRSGGQVVLGWPEELGGGPRCNFCCWPVPSGSEPAAPGRLLVRAAFGVDARRWSGRSRSRLGGVLALDRLDGRARLVSRAIGSSSSQNDQRWPSLGLVRQSTSMPRESTCKTIRLVPEDSTVEVRSARLRAVFSLLSAWTRRPAPDRDPSPK